MVDLPSEGVVSLSNSKAFKPVKPAEGDETTQTLWVTMEDAQINEIILPILTEVNSLRQRVAELEQKFQQIEELRSIVEFLNERIYDDGK